MTVASGQPRRRQPLSRARILEAALELVDREGAEALSMRRLGRELGVAAMSLYKHLDGREALLDGLSEVMVGRIATRPGGAPEEVLRRFAHGIRAVALAHPAAFQLVGMRPLQTPAALLPVEETLGALRALGLTHRDAVHAYRSLAAFARGFALAEIAGLTLEERGGSFAERDPAFAFGVEAFLDGLRARKVPGRTPA